MTVSGIRVAKGASGFKKISRWAKFAVNTLAVAVITLGVTGCASLSSNGAVAVPDPYLEYHHNLEVDAQKVAQLDAFMQSLIDEQKLGAVVGLVAQDGKVLYNKAFGWKNIDKKIPASVNDYYVKFSQTKAMTAVAFMTLVDKGLVKIDDPVSKYFPGIPNRVITQLNDDGSFETREASTPITFIHLLSHSSGIGAGDAGKLRGLKMGIDGRPAGFWGAGIPDLSPQGQRTGGQSLRTATLAEEMEALAKYPLGFDPGTDWNYHPDSNMLGYLIERISGQPLREYVKENILTPLEMNDTDWFYPAEKLSRFVTPYYAKDGQLIEGSDFYARGAVSDVQTYAEGGLGLNGPIGDYAKFAQMLLNKGSFNGKQILKPETVEEMVRINRLSSTAKVEPGFEFGLGFQLFTEQKKPAPSVSDSGFAWGGLMGTEYLIDPDNNAIVLFYTNMYEKENHYGEFLEKAYALINRKQ